MIKNGSPIQAFLSLICVLLLFSLVGMGLFSQRGWLDWRRIVRQNAHLDKQILLIQTEKQELEVKIKRIKNSTAAQERLVRSVLGYVKPGESVIELQ